MNYTDEMIDMFAEYLYVIPGSLRESPAPVTPRRRLEIIFEHILQNTNLFIDSHKTYILSSEMQQALSLDERQRLENDIVTDIIEICSNFTVYPTITGLVRDQLGNPEYREAAALSDDYMELFTTAISSPSPKALLDKMIINSGGDFIEDANVFITYL